MRTLGYIALALLAGCGGFDNQPLREGFIIGWVLVADDEAVVCVDGDPGLSSNLDDDGKFDIDEVPFGRHDVLVLASATHALRVRDVEVPGPVVVDLGVLTPVAGMVVTATLVVPGGQDPSRGTVAVEAVALDPAPVDATGSATLTALPEGCYTLVGALEGLGQARRELCVEGAGTLSLELELPPPDGTDGREGCEVTGCQQGLTCGENGNCS